MQSATVVRVGGGERLSGKGVGGRAQATDGSGALGNNQDVQPGLGNNRGIPHGRRVAAVQAAAVACGALHLQRQRFTVPGDFSDLMEEHTMNDSGRSARRSLLGSEGGN